MEAKARNSPGLAEKHALVGPPLGLPDLYDTRGTGIWEDGIGTGHWCLMGGGHHRGLSKHGDSPTHMCAWSKLALGWLRPVTVTQNTRNVTILPHGSGNFALKLQPPGMPASEYFLVENRQKGLNYDRVLPDSGLLIWHIDESVANTWGNSRQWSPPMNPALGHYQVALEQADGKYELDRANTKTIGDGILDAADMYRPGSTFSDVTNPNSNAYSCIRKNFILIRIY